MACPRHHSYIRRMDIIQHDIHLQTNWGPLAKDSWIKVFPYHASNGCKFNFQYRNWHTRLSLTSTGTETLNAAQKSENWSSPRLYPWWIVSSNIWDLTLLSQCSFQGWQRFLSCSVCVTSVLRLFAIINGGFNHNKIWAGRSATMWSAIEANMAIICSCLPTLRPLATRFWVKLPSTSFNFRLSRSRTDKENSFTTRAQSADGEMKGSTEESFGRSESSLPALPTNETEKGGIRRTLEVEVNHLKK